MKKGHRRTQSSFISRPQASGTGTFQKEKQPSNNVMLLLKESQNKIQNKVVNYERLQINNDQQTNFLSFGNYTINKISHHQQKNTPQPKFYDNNLISIKENSKSSEMSSQKLSHDGFDEEIPQKKLKPKRISDFYQREEETQQKQQYPYNKRNAFPEVRHKKIKSFKIK